MTRRFIRRIAIAAVSAFALAALVPVAAVNAAAASDAVPTVIVLDASGSMVRDAAGGGSRMDQAKQATTAVVDTLAGSVDLGLLVFGTGTSNNDADKVAGCSDVKTLATVGPVDATALKAEISAIKASGFTPLGPSMKQAAAMLPQSGPANIVLVSDGVDTCSPPPACEVASDLRALNSELTIHVVGFAVDADEQAQAQLQCIGAVGGGTYVTAADAKQLAARLSAAVTSSSSSTQLSTLGAHGVRLGDTLDQARTALGTSARITSTETIDGVEIQWVECDWGRVMLRDGRIFGLLPNDGDQTAEGIAVGASLADAEAIYGSAVHNGSDSLGDWSVYALRAGSPQGYRLYNDGKSVTKIVLCLCVPVATSTSDLASWEVSMEAVGPLRLGAPATDVTSLFPSASVKSSYDNTQDVYTVLADPANTWRRVDVTVDKASSTISAITVGVEETLYSASTATNQKGTPELAGPSLPHLAGMRVGDSSRTAKNVFPGMTAFGNQQTQADGLVLTDRGGRVLRIGTAKVSSTSGKREIGGGNIVSFTISDGSTWTSYYYDN